MPSKQFTAADRTALAEVGKVLSQHAEAFGAESLARLFLTHPASKIYFSEFTDYSAAGPRVRVHGAKVLGAVAKAIGHLDDLHTHLEPLAAKHGHDLVVDPQNFPPLAHDSFKICDLGVDSLNVERVYQGSPCVHPCQYIVN
ncbi:hemoglobin subunit alpha-like isoform X4 [Carcharodon carcharias]|uniref:hemoglobin subunit alpha-like isoform X4 n=1 Tax=Carcharodon carcharias TaxID=13397 RepID=UPI001B7E62A4|nr:hemoglobin subunit alpha-like isoform X4 [Carcharodon carcharias]